LGADFTIILTAVSLFSKPTHVLTGRSPDSGS